MQHTCFTKLNTLSQEQMDKIIAITFATFEQRDHASENIVGWTQGLGTFYDDKKIPEESWCKLFTYNDDKQYSSMHYTQDMQFISDLILPEGLKEYVATENINAIYPNSELIAHIDAHRECCLYLPIYPVKEKYMPMMFYYDNQEICIDNYDIGQVYLCNLKVTHSVNNSTDLPRFNYQITLNRPYKEICKLIAS